MAGSIDKLIINTPYEEPQQFGFMKEKKEIFIKKEDVLQDM